MIDFDKLFKSRIGDDRFNTSYPLQPEDWAQYRVDGELPFDGVHELCFYFHIPFCQSLCSFCEYTRMLTPPLDIQQHYLRVLENDIYRFIGRYGGFTLYGLDIGGGTPTALEDSAFAKLMEIFQHVMLLTRQSEDFEPSIEGTFETISPHKAQLAAEAGIHRMSFGIQSTSMDVLSCNHRKQVRIEDIAQKMDMLHQQGIEKINLDFMYGLKGQSIDSLEHDINVIRTLKPEQVTLYELRTNMLSESTHIDGNQRADMYQLLYNSLLGMGYYALFGQNTFSLSKTDMGVSSYLRHRMLQGMPYKGFGVSAQSMSGYGVSYNIGKNSSSLMDILKLDKYKEEFTYRLPTEELASKFVAISSYSGAFSMEAFMRVLQENKDRRTREALLYCLDNGLVSFDDCETVRITPQGFKNMGAVFSLFYPNMN